MSERFLQRSHTGRNGPESLDFEYYFLCTSGDPTSEVYDRVKFSQMDLLLECLEGGRLFESGLHLDDTFKRMRGWVLIGMHTLDPQLMRAVDLGCMMVRSNCSQTRKKIEGELKNWNFNEPVTAHQCPTSFGVHAGMYCCLMDCVRSALAEYLGWTIPTRWY